jgi:hypothetical protein
MRPSVLSILAVFTVLFALAPYLGLSLGAFYLATDLARIARCGLYARLLRRRLRAWAGELRHDRVAAGSS